MNLTQKTDDELKQLRDRIDVELKERSEAKIRQFKIEIKQRADEIGVSLEEMFKAPATGKPRGKAAPKYQNPANSSEIWTGRGRKPGWVRNALAAGKTLDQLLIP